MAKIKTIFFDVGGVLQLGGQRTTGVHKYVSAKLGISLDQYFDAIDTIYAKSIEGKISEQQAVEAIAKNLKIPKRKLEKLYKIAYKKNFRLNKELLTFSKKLRKRGFQISIISDMWHLSKKALIIKKFYKTFNSVIISCDVKTRKPHKKIFDIALKKSKTKPNQSIFVDNQEWNTKPAEKWGFKIVLFKDNKQTIQEIEKIIK